MEFLELNAEVREEKGSSVCKSLRRGGLIPAVCYKKGEDSLSLKIQKREFLKLLKTEAGENVILTLKIQGQKKIKPKTVIIKELQRDILKDELLHIDFNEISLTQVLRVKVPLVSKGEAIGVKQEGGVLQQILWEVEVECLPTNIPERLEMDISNLKINDAVFVKDIVVPEGVKILQDLESIVFSVEPPIVEKPKEEAVVEEITEPEVIRERKPKEEEVEEAAPQKPEKPEKIEKKEEKK